MRIADMLSNPFYSFSTSLETSSEKSSYRIVPSGFFPILAFSHPIISPLLLSSQIPSHPMIKKSSPSFFIFVISGFAVIICSSAERFLEDLYSKSPMALERFKLPLMRPSSMVPPALIMRSLYDFYSGLWSLLSSLASPLRLQMTALESPW